VRGNVDVYASIIVASGTITGGIVGARMANLTSERTLSRVVGGIFMALGVLMTVLRL